MSIEAIFDAIYAIANSHHDWMFSFTVIL